MKTAYRITWIDSQGKITARDEKNRDRIFDTLDYPEVIKGDTIEVEADNKLTGEMK
jgi:hypothetical protein